MCSRRIRALILLTMRVRILLASIMAYLIIGILKFLWTYQKFDNQVFFPHCPYVELYKFTKIFNFNHQKIPNLSIFLICPENFAYNLHIFDNDLVIARGGIGSGARICNYSVWQQSLSKICLILFLYQYFVVL